MSRQKSNPKPQPAGKPVAEKVAGYTGDKPSMGNSEFPIANEAEFILTGTNVDYFTPKGETESRQVPVYTTDLGKSFSVAMLTRLYLDDKLKEWRSEGTVVDLYKRVASKEQFLKYAAFALTLLCGDHKVKHTQRAYRGIYGPRYVHDLNFVEEGLAFSDDDIKKAIDVAHAKVDEATKAAE